MAKLYSLGDSWAWGWSGFDYKKNVARHPFTQKYSQILADKLGLELINWTCPGNSFPQITQHFFRRVAPIVQPEDVVFITLPPDIRWHKAVPENFHITNNATHYPWSNQDSEDTMSMLFGNGAFNHRAVEASLDQLESEVIQNNFNPYWFKYNTSLQLTAITTYSKVNNVKTFIQHNYGDLQDLLEVTDYDCVLDTQHSMWEWIGLPKLKSMLSLDHDGPREETLTDDVQLSDIRQIMMERLLIDGESFDWHPNKLSHQIIGDKLYELCNQRMG